MPGIDSQDLIDIDQGNLDPYYVNPLFLEGCVLLQKLAVDSIYELIRIVEENRGVSHLEEDLISFLQLQDSGRYSIQIQSRSESAIDLVITLMAAHQDWNDSDLSSNITAGYGRSVSSRLSFCRSALQSLLFRANEYVSRTDNEIQLASNLVSLDIAKAAARDADVMKSLSVIGAIFIASTSIVALFSTSFFNIDDAVDWYLHQKFLIYSAVSIPYSFLLALAIAYTVGYRFRRNQCRQIHVTVLTIVVNIGGRT